MKAFAAWWFWIGQKQSFEMGDQPTVWCEAGLSSRKPCQTLRLKGLAGLEWSATVPGTVGGAVYGNAGAFGGE